MQTGANGPATNEFGMCDIAKLHGKLRQEHVPSGRVPEDYPEIDLSNYYKVSNSEYSNKSIQK